MLNKVILIGRFTRDPELRSTPQGTSTCSFSLAVDRNYQSAGGERQADFINCVAWRQTAEFISKYFQKGNMVCVEGSIQTGSYVNKNGVTVYTTDVLARKVKFAESKPNSNSPAARNEQPNYYQPQVQQPQNNNYQNNYPQTNNNFAQPQGQPITDFEIVVGNGNELPY